MRKVWFHEELPITVSLFLSVFESLTEDGSWLATDNGPGFPPKHT